MPKMEFVLVEADVLGVGVEWTLAVLNNEVGFSRANVESLCSVGLSTKKGKRDTHGYIGEKGNITTTSTKLTSPSYHVRYNHNDKCVYVCVYAPSGWIKQSLM